MIIAISGPSGSGKTTFAQELIKRLDNSAVSYITLDSYYKDQSHLTLEEREKINYDQPDTFEFDLFIDQLTKLASGSCIEKPIYDFITHTRSRKKETIVPRKIIITDGIFTFYNNALRKIMDIKVYLDVSPVLCFIRRLQRDVRERGRTMESVIEQYLQTVQPMQEKYIIPSKQFADIIVPQGGFNSEMLNALMNRIKERINL